MLTRLLAVVIVVGSMVLAAALLGQSGGEGDEVAVEGVESEASSAPSDPSPLAGVPELTELAPSGRTATSESGGQVEVRGRVLIPPGTPADEVLGVSATHVFREEGERRTGRAHPVAPVDERGEFRLVLEDGATFVGLLVSLEGRYLYLERLHQQTSLEDIVLHPKVGGRILGRIVTSAGRPITGVEVTCQGPERQAPPSSEAQDGSDSSAGRSVLLRSGTDGEFASGALEPGSYVVSVEHESIPPQIETLELSAGESTSVEFVVDPVPSLVDE